MLPSPTTSNPSSVQTASATPPVPAVKPAFEPSKTTDQWSGFQSHVNSVKNFFGNQMNNMHQGLRNINQGLDLQKDFHGLRDSYGRGDYFDAYSRMMQLQGKLKANPELAQSTRKIIDTHFPEYSMPMNMAGAWHGMVSDPAKFSQLLGGLAPDMLRGAGPMAVPAAMGLFGLASGNKGLLNDFKALFPGKWSPTQA